MRKTRSAHVKCDCGKRARDAATGSASPQGDKSKCHCFEDGKCKCAFKQEPLTRVTVPPADSDDGTSASVPSVGDSACGWGPDTLPWSSLLALDEPDHCDSEAWQNHGLLQLDQEHPHPTFNGLGTGWDGSLAHPVGEDPQDWRSSTFHDLDMPQLPLDLSNIDSLGNSHSTPFDGFPGTAQDMLSWAPGEPGLPSSHNHDEIVGSAEPLWFEGPDQSTVASSTFGEHAAAESATASGDLTRGAAPE
ncbi:Copper resistance protein CRF1 [Tolypocladium paradoxum]|uniref:Copper resistance protein CRF1 n=1 Tax=Tolypocladium paradoxum TaxID=94208 RepID=A0A2S4KL60_9HYPO|nr:Copper resistance protein CRF1 [Tolypocladium paradoxum]